MRLEVTTARPAPPTNRRPQSAAVDSGPSPALLAYARRLADDHQATHHRPITGEHLATRMHVSADLATDLLTQIRKEPVT